MTNNKEPVFSENSLIVNETISMMPGVIDFPEYAKLKTQADAIADFLSHAIVTEENIKTNKKALAAVRKQIGKLDARRIEIKKAYTEPLAEFESQVKEITDIIKKAEGVLRSQVRELEDRERTEKAGMIEDLFDSRVSPMIKTEADREVFSFNAFFDPKMLNKTTSMSQIEKRIGEWIQQTLIDLQAVEVSDHKEEVLEEYLRRRNFATALKAVRERHERIEKLRETKEPEKKSDRVRIEIQAEDWAIAKALLEKHEIKFDVI